VLNLEELGPWTRGEMLRFLWCRLRLAACEMYYATRRLLALQMRLPPRQLPCLQATRHRAGRRGGQ